MIYTFEDENSCGVELTNLPTEFLIEQTEMGSYAWEKLYRSLLQD